jgi:hypothetical protein
MPQIIRSLSLRRVLLLDTIATGATALLLLMGAEQLASLLGLPIAMLRESGLILAAFVVFVGWMAAQEPAPISAVRLVIAANVIWVAASLMLLVSGFVEPTAAGYVLISAQALVVGGFAELQMMALRRSRLATA